MGPWTAAFLSRQDFLSQRLNGDRHVHPRVITNHRRPPLPATTVHRRPPLSPSNCEGGLWGSCRAPVAVQQPLGRTAYPRAADRFITSPVVRWLGVLGCRRWCLQTIVGCGVGRVEASVPYVLYPGVPAWQMWVFGWLAALAALAGKRTPPSAQKSIEGDLVFRRRLRCRPQRLPLHGEPNLIYQTRSAPSRRLLPAIRQPGRFADCATGRPLGG